MAVRSQTLPGGRHMSGCRGHVLEGAVLAGLQTCSYAMEVIGHGRGIGPRTSLAGTSVMRGTDLGPRLIPKGADTAEWRSLRGGLSPKHGAHRFTFLRPRAVTWVTKVLILSSFARSPLAPSLAACSLPHAPSVILPCLTFFFFKLRPLAVTVCTFF